MTAPFMSTAWASAGPGSRSRQSRRAARDDRVDAVAIREIGARFPACLTRFGCGLTSRRRRTDVLAVAQRL